MSPRKPKPIPPLDEDPLVDETLAVFQPRTSRKLSREDGRQIRENLCGFFALLLEWDRRERAEAGGVER